MAKSGLAQSGANFTVSHRPRDRAKVHISKSFRNAQVNSCWGLTCVGSEGMSARNFDASLE